MAPSALTLLATLRSYAAHQYEGGGACNGPWPDDPDGGQMRLIAALDAVLCQCARQPDWLPYGDLVREIGQLFACTQNTYQAHAPVLERIVPPWDADTVEALTLYQSAGVGHPFTCPDCAGSPSLVATPDGWECGRCPYTQKWAHAFMITEEARTWPTELMDLGEH